MAIWNNAFVDIGDVVSQGDILAILASPELEQQIIQAKAEITRQQAEVALAERVANRFTNLRDSGAVNDTEVDEREAEHAVAIATLKVYQARLDELENQYAYTRITAPFDGVITRRNAERGNRISRNDTQPLFRISQVDRLRVVVDVPQTQLYAIDTSEQAELVVAELRGKHFQVPVARLAGEIDRSSGTMRIEYELDNRQGLLDPGLTGEIRIAARPLSNQYRVPVNVLKIIAGQSTVYWVDAQDIVQTRAVTVGRLGNRQIDILEGLDGQERIVLNPNARLQPGMKVSVSDR